MAISAFLMLSTAARAQDEKFKALFMYNFTKYIEWPQAKQSGDFVIGVIGNSAIVGELETIAQKKTVGAQAIKVKQVSSAEDLTKMHIVYVTEDKSGEAAGIAAAWGLSKGIPVSEIKWEEMPEEMRSYVSK